MSRSLVLDNSVLSAFVAGGWFDDLGFWTTEYELLTTTRIWKREFRPHHGRSKPDWLVVETVDTSELTGRSVSLGEADWSLVRLAETAEEPILVSNDRKLIEESERRGIERIWGTKFLIQTFEACGIEEDAFRNGLPEYTNDVTLPDAVVSELRATEKPEQ